MIRRFQGKKGALLELDSARVALDRAHARRRNAILFARSKGATWREIGDALQMSASGAASLVAPAKPKEPLPVAPDPALVEEVERV